MVIFHSLFSPVVLLIKLINTICNYTHFQWWFMMFYFLFSSYSSGSLLMEVVAPPKLFSLLKSFKKKWRTWQHNIWWQSLSNGLPDKYVFTFLCLMSIVEHKAKRNFWSRTISLDGIFQLLLKYRMKKNGRFESYKHVMLFYANFLLDEDDDDDDDREWTKKRLMKHHYVYFDKCRNSFYERERCSLRG